MLAVAIGGLIVNLIGVQLLHAGSGESLNMRGAFLEVMADLLGSIGVIIAALVIQFTGFWQADPTISIVIGLFILPRTWGLLKSAVDVLLEAVPAHLNTDDITRAIRAVPGVMDLHDLHVWSITSGYVALSAHVLVNGRGSMDVLHDIQAMLRSRFAIEHSTLQIESVNEQADSAGCALDPRCLTVTPIPGMPRLTRPAGRTH
jgi:cobalt-zinc-cadmium efflux system protein